MIGVCALVTLAFGVWPAPLVDWAKGGLQALAVGLTG